MAKLKEGGKEKRIRKDGCSATTLYLITKSKGRKEGNAGASRKMDKTKVSSR